MKNQRCKRVPSWVLQRIMQGIRVPIPLEKVAQGTGLSMRQVKKTLKKLESGGFAWVSPEGKVHVRKLKTKEIPAADKKLIGNSPVVGQPYPGRLICNVCGRTVSEDPEDIEEAPDAACFCEDCTKQPKLMNAWLKKERKFYKELREANPEAKPDAEGSTFDDEFTEN